MRLRSGDNHLISEREGVVTCEVWTREDLSAEQGAKNADEMTSFLRHRALGFGTSYRGLIFDVRRGPAVFGPKTRESLVALFKQAAEVRVSLAVLPSQPMQVVQFRNLCGESGGRADVFESTAEAERFVSTVRPSRPPGAS